MSLSSESREAVKTVAIMAATIHAAKVQANTEEQEGAHTSTFRNTTHRYNADCHCVEEARLMFNETIERLSGETE